VNHDLYGAKTALLSQEGSGIAKQIPQGVVSEHPTSKFLVWNHPGAPSLDVPPLLTQEGCFALL